MAGWTEKDLEGGGGLSAWETEEGGGPHHVKDGESERRYG